MLYTLEPTPPRPRRPIAPAACLALAVLLFGASALPVQAQRSRSAQPGGVARNVARDTSPVDSSHGGPIWFDGDWQPCERSDARYYRLWRRADDTTFIIRDFFLSGRLQMKGRTRRPSVPLYYRFGLYSYYYNDGMKSREGVYVNDTMEGVWQTWHDNGALSSVGLFMHGKESGGWIWHDSLGNRSDSLFYAAGLRHGASVGWYPDGRNKYVGAYADDKREGVWQWWYADGREMAREEYATGDRTGLWEAWYSNGNPRHRGHYLRDERDGTWEWYRADGTRSDSSFYSGGTLNGRWMVWHRNGRPARQIEYVDGKAAGAWSEWFDNGSVSATGAYRVGARSGEWREYFRSGELAGECTYDSSSSKSAWTYYHRSGRKSGRETYRDDTVLVASEYWDDDGIKIEEDWKATAEPAYVGGFSAFRRFRRKNLHYPPAASEAGIDGTVHVELLVLEDGSVHDVRLTEEVDPLLDAEALRVARLITKMRPGRLHNRVCEAWVTLDFPFVLDGE